uniref:uncharacterized protein LOC122590445 n=1 Tax=Erigeron canadensis TaxID=72917 RepID=UPI001CB8B205|nr:uncharacterized protein LOC122590445 [Erigeron canadensis]
MGFWLTTLVACCGANECDSVSRSSVTLTSFISKNNNDHKNLLVGLVHKDKVDGIGKKGRKSVRQPIQWRPSLFTIFENDVVMFERIQLYVKPCNKGRKSTRMLTPNFTSSGYNKNEFVLRDSWNMVSPIPTAFVI